MSFRNFPMVPRVVFGRGSFNQLAEILEPKRKSEGAPFIFLVDDVFRDKESLVSRIPLRNNDKIIFISAEEEPKTIYVDDIRDGIVGEFDETPSGIIGIGGGNTNPVQGEGVVFLVHPANLDKVAFALVTGY